MSILNVVYPVEFERARFNVKLIGERFPIPADVQARVDDNFAKFSEKVVAGGGKAPTKGENAVLRKYSVLADGLEGTCGISTFDEVLYFARSQIPEQDYAVGRQVGFPLASWGVLLSKDDQLIFIRKKGKEGAYEGSPYSGSGALVSVKDDFKDGLLSPQGFLDRSIGKEIGKAVWERKVATRFMGLNAHDKNSAKVNNGYDLVLEAAIDATASQILEGLEDNPQFVRGGAIYVPAQPDSLRAFAQGNPMTASGLAGIFCYMGSRYEIDEARKQLDIYRSARPDADISFA